MTNEADVKDINARYRAYCDACQSGHLAKVPSFWSLPALFALDTGEPETSQQLLSTPEEMIKLYSTLFGSSPAWTRRLSTTPRSRSMAISSQRSPPPCAI